MSKPQSDWARKMTLKEQTDVTVKMMRYAAPFKWMFIGAASFSAFATIMNVLRPRVIQSYIDQYLSLGQGTGSIALGFALMYLALVLSQAIFNYCASYLFSYASEKSVSLVRNTLYDKVLHLGMRYFDQVPAGSVVSRVTNDTETLKGFWRVFYSLFEGIFSCLFIFIGMYVLNKEMALLFLLFLPLMVGAILIYQSLSSRIYRTIRENLSRLNAKLNENISGMNLIQHFRQEERMIKEFEEENDKQYKARLSNISMNGLLLNPFIGLLESLSLALVFYYLGNQYFDGHVEIGVVFAFTQYSTSFFRPMGMMMDSLSQLQDGVVSSSRIQTILNHQELAPHQKEEDIKVTEGKIEFQNVSFSYDGQHKVLDNISFTALPGETVALVGHTGSGKSSIINVLMRFYEFQEGNILIDGQDIRSYAYKELRDHIGLVLQDPFIFYGDVERNIRLLDTSYSLDAIQEAAQFVNADIFIERDPEGYHKKVIEGGAAYSAGQKQLLSFARTILRDPKVLILDEATANIDTETEIHIQESLSKMRKGRTTIAIAHRLSTIRDADQILVLDKGKIIEQGNHETLINQQGVYYQMYQLQTLGAE